MQSEFIVNGRSAFQDREYLYLSMDLYSGGDLRYHLIKKKFFSEREAKFMIACVVQGMSRGFAFWFLLGF